MSKIFISLSLIFSISFPLYSQMIASAVSVENDFEQSLISNITPDEPDYIAMAKQDCKKFFKVKKQFWSGLVCGFTPVVGWVAAPIIASSVKFKDEQMKTPFNNHNYLIDSNPLYGLTFRKACVRKRRNGFIIGFGVGVSIIAGYFFATQGEYQK